MRFPSWKMNRFPGIYYVGKSPALTVAANGIPQSILNPFVWLRNREKHHPADCPHSPLWSLEWNPADVKPAGNHYPDFPWWSYHQRQCTVFLCTDCNDLPLWLFIGFGSAITLQANITALAARRCVTPTHKLKLILSEQIASFFAWLFRCNRTSGLSSLYFEAGFSGKNRANAADFFFRISDRRFHWKFLWEVLGK